MSYAKFLTYSLFGGIFWIAFMTTLGYKMGQIELVRRNFEKVILGIIFLLTVFVVVQFYLQQEVAGKDTALNRLNAQIAQLTELLGLEKSGKAGLEDQLAQFLKCSRRRIEHTIGQHQRCNPAGLQQLDDHLYERNCLV